MCIGGGGGGGGFQQAPAPIVIPAPAPPTKQFVYAPPAIPAPVEKKMQMRPKRALEEKRKKAGYKRGKRRLTIALGGSSGDTGVNG